MKTTNGFIKGAEYMINKTSLFPKLINQKILQEERLRSLLYHKNIQGGNVIDNTQKKHGESFEKNIFNKYEDKGLISIQGKESPQISKTTVHLKKNRTRDINRHFTEGKIQSQLRD